MEHLGEGFPLQHPCASHIEKAPLPVPERSIGERPMHSGERLIPRLRDLYQEMDSAYSALANQAGFSCTGCDGAKCCTVDLMLHTFIEKLYLRRGFNVLEPSLQLEVLGRCKTVLRAKQEDPYGYAYRTAVCVLNFDGRCRLYEHRPMICRLSGVPHFIRKPDGQKVLGPACERFRAEVASDMPDDAELDRTDFYRRLAEIEIQMVRELGQRTVSRTVAETLGEEHPEELLP